MPSNLSAAPQRRVLSAVLLGLICLAYSAWVLSLPLFPTQDGPMHLYFMHVLQSLLTHPDGFYSHFYFVRHLLPPYALYYYALMLLSSFVPVLLADKLIICLYFFSFTFGFRYLARAIGPNGDLMALLSTILLLNWPLGMGFVNFSLSVSFAFWALGLWCRAAGRRDPLRMVAFTLMCYVIMFTHPVPLLAVLGFCFVELLVRLVQHRRQQSNSRALPAHWLADAGFLALSSGTLAYVKLFTTNNVLKQVHVSPQSPLRAELSLLKGYVLLHSLTAFAGRSALDSLYRLIFYALLAGCLALAIRQLRRAVRASNWTLAETWTVLAVLLLLGFPLIPSDLNNSAYFAARLVIFVWIAALLAASGARFARPVTSSALTVGTLLATVLILFMAQTRIRPIADDIARIETMPAIPEHSVGLLMHSPTYQLPSTTTYDPYFWSGVRMFRRTDSVMYNTPWLDLAIIPLGPTSSMPTYHLSANDLEYPPGLRLKMASSPELRTSVLSHLNLTIISSGRRTAGPAQDALLPSGWHCQPQATYSFCSPQEEPKMARY